MHLTSEGVSLHSVYTSDGDVLLGSARLQKEASDRRAASVADHEHEERELHAEQELNALEGRLNELEGDLARKRDELVELKAARVTMLESEEEDLRERVDARAVEARSPSTDTQEQP